MEAAGWYLLYLLTVPEIFNRTLKRVGHTTTSGKYDIDEALVDFKNLKPEAD